MTATIPNMEHGRESGSTPPVVARLIDRLYGRPPVRNVLRGELVEQMVLDALGSEWVEAGDYGSWDIQHRIHGWRLQVKQAAAMQSWSAADVAPSRCRFTIGAKAGYSDKRNRWDGPRERRCDLYIFAWHPVLGTGADHRMSSQWDFYVVPAVRLPIQDTIGLSAIQLLTARSGCDRLADAIQSSLAT